MNSKTQIAMSVTCYENEEEVISFIKHVHGTPYGDTLLYLVTDNSLVCSDTLAKELRGTGADFRLYCPPANLGYLNGCLYGIQQCKQEGYDIDWFIISNTDLKLNEDFLLELYRTIEETSSWCIGPRVTLFDRGEEQNPFLIKPPKKGRRIAWRLAYSSYSLFTVYAHLSRFLRSFHKRNARYCSKRTVVYALHGSIFIGRHDFIEAIAEVSGCLFMYGEEMLIAVVTEKNGKSLLYDPKLKVVHHENQVTKGIASITKFHWMQKAYTNISNLHKSRFK